MLVRGEGLVDEHDENGEGSSGRRMMYVLHPNYAADER